MEQSPWARLPSETDRALGICPRVQTEAQGGQGLPKGHPGCELGSREPARVARCQSCSLGRSGPVGLRNPGIKPKQRSSGQVQGLGLNFLPKITFQKGKVTIDIGPSLFMLILLCISSI